jgi:hypothetical protein
MPSRSRLGVWNEFNSIEGPQIEEDIERGALNNDWAELPEVHVRNFAPDSASVAEVEAELTRSMILRKPIS